MEKSIKNREDLVTFCDEPLYSDLYYLVHSVGSSNRVDAVSRNKQDLIDVAMDYLTIFPDRQFDVVKVRTVSEKVCHLS